MSNAARSTSTPENSPPSGTSQPPETDPRVADMVRKAWELHEKLGPRGFRMITPPDPLKKKVRPMRRKGFDPVAAAERNLEIMSVTFSSWLNEEREHLHKAYEALEANPDNPQCYEAMNRAVHRIKGNAPILGNVAAGMIADPLSRLLENCADYQKTRPVLALSVHAICQALEQETPANDPELVETVNMLQSMAGRCIIAKDTARDTSRNATKDAAGCRSRTPCPKDQAAGRTSCPLAPVTCGSRI